jgi:hypothetical protein
MVKDKRSAITVIGTATDALKPHCISDVIDNHGAVTFRRVSCSYLDLPQAAQVAADNSHDTLRLGSL